MSGVLKVIYNIVRGLIRLFVNGFIVAVTAIIKLLTYERGKNGKITVRKARRIRLLSKFKNTVINTLPQSVVSFLGWESYKEYFNKHIRNGLQLC